MNKIDYCKIFVNRGWFVLPVHGIKDGVCTCSNGINCSSPGKRPIFKDWQKRATRDLNQIGKWLREKPEMNIGIKTGRESDLIVLDVDARNGGLESLEMLAEKYGPLTDTVYVETGGGGYHFYFRYKNNQEIKNAVNLLPGIDLRAAGGLVVAPPSNHVSGGIYEFEFSCFPDEKAPLIIPDWLLSLCKKGNQSPPKLQTSSSNPILEGGRNSYLTTIAGKLRHEGYGFETILSGILERNESDCIPPLDHTEVENIARSISNYDIGQNPIDYIKSSIVPANERLANAMKLEKKYPLLDPFWHEGDLHIHFARPGEGKSLLITQLVNQICEGKGLFGLESSGSPKRVIYYELELSEYQFGARYTNNDNHGFSFSDNLLMGKFEDINTSNSKNKTPLHQLIIETIRRDLEDYNADVAIIDNISYISTETQADANVAMEIVRGLHDIVRNTGKSILAIGHTPKKPPNTPLTMDDLAGSSSLSRFIDTMSAIGGSVLGPNMRYLIQLKARVKFKEYGEHNVMGLVLEEDQYGFPSFRAVGTSPERDHLKDYSSSTSIPSKLEAVSHDVKKGIDYRTIANKHGIAPGTISKWKDKYPDYF